MTLQGHVALVTGGSRGIGRAACLAFAREGADVAVQYLREREAAESVAREVHALGRRALVVQAEVSDENDVTRMLDEVAAFAPRLHVLFNNAGIYPIGGIEELSLEEWERVIAVNVRGPFLVTRAALPLMKTGGRVINVGSVMALKGTPGALHYVTSKAAIVGFTRGLARELGGYGITVNCVVPSIVRTETAERDFGESFRPIVAEQVVPQTQEPEDLTGLLCFLASPQSRFVTGQTIVADGGRVFL
jgi:3-oxoacyl-[acyl-carrier protein] reductase